MGVPDRAAVTSTGVGSLRQELDASESVQLFNDRVMEVDAAFKLGERNATAVIEIRRKLEGIPLAIELAAPLVRVLSIDELNDRLNDRLALLAGEVEERDGRHRAIRASIAWSYELLDPGAKGFFRQLGLLQSGFTLETLDGLLGDRFDTLTEVERLIEQNLVHLGRFQRQSDRFTLLESVRQFALDELEAAGELASARERPRAISPIECSRVTPINAPSTPRRLRRSRSIWMTCARRSFGSSTTI